MYGKYVEVELENDEFRVTGKVNVWVWCNPKTPNEELTQMAIQKAKLAIAALEESK